MCSISPVTDVLYFCASDTIDISNDILENIFSFCYIKSVNIHDKLKYVFEIYIVYIVFFILVWLVLNQIGRKKKTEWYKNLTPFEEKRVMYRVKGGYIIMMCASCQKWARFGPSNDGIPVACCDHKSRRDVLCNGC